MGAAGVNIATMDLGRDKPGGEAICIVSVDEPVSDRVLAEIKGLEQVQRVNRLRF
jgi:D-3-phosphoglycerate dehydrogenase